MAIHVSIRGLGGEKELDLDDGTTIGDLKRLNEIAGGLNVRFNGESARDDQELSDGDTLVTTPPAAKHGINLS